MDKDTYNCLLLSYKQLKDELRKLNVPNRSKLRTKKEMCQKLLEMGWRSHIEYELPEKYKQSETIQSGTIQSQNYFENLPNETLESICSDMDTQTLIKFSQTYKRIGLVCSQVIRKRKIKEYIILLFANITFDKIHPQINVKSNIGLDEERDGYYIQEFINPVNSSSTFEDIGLIPEQIELQIPDPSFPFVEKIENFSVKEIYRQYEIPVKMIKKEYRGKEFEEFELEPQVLLKLVEFLIDYGYYPNDFIPEDQRSYIIDHDAYNYVNPAGKYYNYFQYNIPDLLIKFSHVYSKLREST